MQRVTRTLTLSDSYLKRRALTAYAQLCARQGYLFQQPSDVDRTGDLLILSNAEGPLAKFGILPSGRLEPIED